MIFMVFAPRVPPLVGGRRARWLVLSEPAGRGVPCQGDDTAALPSRGEGRRRAGANAGVNGWHGSGMTPAAVAIGAAPIADRDEILLGQPNSLDADLAPH